MNILVAAAEVTPFAKVGGLADMAGALPKAWAEDGHNVVVILPLYGTIDKEKYGIEKTDMLVDVPFGTWTECAEVWHGVLPGTTIPVYFLRSSDYYDRPGIYGYHEGFEDNDRRFIFLSRAVFEVARALDFRPDVIHAHDYHTAPCMPMLKVHYHHDEFFRHTAGVFTIHNMAYQGMYDPQRAMEFCGFPASEFYTGSWYEQDGIFNAMKAGILFADKITTVSPTYAQEIRWTPEGMGLQGALQSRGADLIGVLNGIDAGTWSPMHDEHIAVPYSSETIAKKDINKRALLKEVGLSPSEIKRDLPVVGMVTRLTEQKGISLLMSSIEAFVAEDRIRLVILGSGEAKFEDFLLNLAYRYPNHVKVGTGYNEPLSHRIQAGSDYYLMPSRFEPCGLTQMFALAYGTIPIVRSVGGLADTVQDYDPISFVNTGVLFHRYTGDALSHAMDAALRLYKREPHWTHIRRNAMARDNSIAATARRYVEVFGWAQEHRR
ncbi:MAG: glycogen/starch synthase [Candidatus Kapabacteria bacterium]|nr:glycogen/starch synthase [Candidatus Kapabacteria bacterium]